MGYYKRYRSTRKYKSIYSSRYSGLLSYSRRSNFKTNKLYKKQGWEMIELYLILSTAVLVIGILNLSNDVFSMNTTRSRESKVLIREQIKRNKKIILLSSAWPVLIAIAVKDIVKGKDLVFLKSDDTQKRG